MSSTDSLGRIDQYEWTAWIDGVFCGVWDDKAGGAVTAMETKIRRGGMGPQVSLGGQTSISNLTLTKFYARNSPEKKFIQSRVGTKRVEAHGQPLDADGNPFGDADVYRGVLNAWTPADSKAESNDGDTYSIEVSTDGVIG
jgi:hypothetical protein